ncbi:hypothetical protein [Streptomyces sp. NPDC050538]|uniref:hypothetical protein n=1 Tax=Streptomyces sp. NPDC050538 TaxID=3365627 RepID=UPI0037BAF66C
MPKFTKITTAGHPAYRFEHDGKTYRAHRYASGAGAWNVDRIDGDKRTPVVRGRDTRAAAVAAVIDAPKDEQPSKLDELAAAALPKGTRVRSHEGRLGTVNGVDVGRVTDTDHPNYGREYVGVNWDAVEGDMGCGRRSRPFVDELSPVTPQDGPREGERVTYSVGKHTVNATVTRLANDAGQVGVVDDGDQTGSVRRVASGLLTVQAPDLDRLHGAALEMDRLRSELMNNGNAPAPAATPQSELATAKPINVIDRLDAIVRSAAGVSGPGKSPISQDPLAAVDFGEPRCVHGFYERPEDRSKPVEACKTKQPTASVGVLSDEGCVDQFDCAVQASDAAARMNAAEQHPADEPLYRWGVLCTEHEEQPAATCEDCFADPNAG